MNYDPKINIDTYLELLESKLVSFKASYQKKAEMDKENWPDLISEDEWEAQFLVFMGAI